MSPSVPVPDPEDISAELRERDQWLLWDDSADTPRRPHWRGDFWISWNDPDDWHSFEEAREAALERDSWGIGYVFARSNDDHPRGLYGALDLDGCAEEGKGRPKEWLPSLQPFADRDAYVEWSPSGAGLHIPLAGFEPPEWWSDSHFTDDEHEGVEAYGSKFFTVTGDQIRGAGNDVADAGQWVDEWLAQVYKSITGEDPRNRGAENGSSGSKGGGSGSETTTRNGDEWIDAEIAREALEHVDPDVSYPTWRDIGFALADEFSERTALSIFEDWSRGGSKWDDEAERLAESIITDADRGGGRTISTVVYYAKQGGWDASRGAREATADGGTAAANTSSTAPTASGETSADWGTVRALFDSDENGSTTQGYARAADLLEQDHSFAAIRETDELYYYDPGRGHYVRKGESFIAELLQEYIPGYVNTGRQKNIHETVRARNYLDADSFAPPEGKVCVENGVLDLETRELEPHSPEYYFTSRLQTPYIEGAEADRWERFLEESTATEEARKLEEFIGYALETWHHDREKNLFVVGPRQSGKSTFVDTVQALFGSMPTVTNLTPQQVADTQFDAASLKEAALNAVNDINATKIEDTGALKRVFSGEHLKLERKYQDAHYGAPKAKHLFSANWLPTVVGQDESLYRRVLIVEFPDKLDDDERDRHLKNKLEAELPGILERALDARDRLSEQDGFTNDRSDTETRRKWDSWLDAHKRFLYTQFRITGDSSDTVGKEAYYRAYKEYCGRKGYELKPKQGVTKSLQWVPEIETGDDEYRGLAWRTEDAADAGNPDDAAQVGLGDASHQKLVTKITKWVDDFATPVNGAHREDVLEYAEQQGEDPERVADMIDTLADHGKLYEPADGELWTK